MIKTQNLNKSMKVINQMTMKMTKAILGNLGLTVMMFIISMELFDGTAMSCLGVA